MREKRDRASRYEGESWIVACRIWPGRRTFEGEKEAEEVEEALEAEEAERARGRKKARKGVWGGTEEAEMGRARTYFDVGG